MFNRCNASFLDERITPRIAAEKLAEPGSWILYKDHKNPVAVRRLDEERLFYAGILQSSVLYGKTFVAGIVEQKNGGSRFASHIEIKTDRKGNVLEYVVDSEFDGNVTRVYKRRSVDRDWQFCMYKSRDRFTWVDVTRAIVDRNNIKTMCKRKPISERQYPPQKIVRHLASLSEPSNRHSAQLVMKKAPRIENGGPVLPNFVAEFTKITSDRDLQEVQVVERLEDFVTQYTSFLQDNSDLE